MAVKHKFTSAKVDDADATLVRPSNWNDDHAGNNQTAVLVAANNSSVAHKASADYLCDGTADEVQVQAALDALTAGGVVTLAPGTYNFAAQVLVTANQRLVLECDGATINLASGIIGFKVNQTSGSGIRGVHIRGARIIGTAKTGTNVGIELEDTNNSTISGAYISGCLVGILFEAQAASAFVEGTLLDDILIRDCGTGWQMTTVSGTGSWMQTTARHLKIADCTIGVDLQAGGQLMRSHVWGTTWVSTNQTGWRLDGIIEDTHLFMAVEGATAATGTVGVYIGANASQTEQCFLHGLFTGAITTQIDNTASPKDFVIAVSGTTEIYSTGFARRSFRRYGDAADRMRYEMVTAGGKISFGDGTAAVDTNIYRSAANVLKSDDKLDPASLNLQVKAGVPVDGDVIGGAADGDTVLDTTGKVLYVRTGGAWVPLNTPLQARGGTVLSPSAAVNVYVWRASFACTVTNVRGIRRGGTGATINARRNGSSNHLATALSLTSADTWMDGGAVQNTAFAVGDTLEIMVVSVAGSPTEVGIQVDFTRP